MDLAVTEIAGHGKAVVHHGYGFCRTRVPLGLLSFVLPSPVAP